jgi:hypothetical protein
MRKHHKIISLIIQRLSAYPVTIGLIVFFILSAMMGCTVVLEETTYPAAATTLPPRPTITLHPSSTPLITHQPLSSSSGPYLLIQSDITQYEIIDLSTKISASFDPPSPAGQYRLSGLQSPSGRLMFFPTDHDQIMVTDLTKDEVLDTHLLLDSEFEFKSDLAVDKAQSFLEEGQYSHDSLKAMVEDAFQKSLSDIRWYKNDQYWLLPRVSSPTSTNLTLYNLDSKSFTNLENQPGLVLGFQVGPDGDHILLKKGYINEPLMWKSIQYYLVDVNRRKTEPILLPENINNPTLFWLQNDTIGIIHQMAPIGGLDFSIMNLNGDETKQIINGAFSHISLYNGSIFWVKESLTEKMTTVGLSTLQAETLRQQTIDQRCSYKTRMDNLIFLNCEMDSLFINENLDVTPVGSSVSLLVPASQSEIAVLVTQDEAVFLLNRKTLERDPLALEGRPLEIRWLPDGTGFLYRITGKLLIYDLESGESSLLLNEQSLGDYTNINAVWIKVD